MPRKEIDWSKTIIYKIVCKDLDVDYVYVGQTTNLFNRRSTHKSHCNNEKDKKHHYLVYEKIRENGGFNNWDVVEIEKILVKILTKLVQERGSGLNILGILTKSYLQEQKKNIV